MKLRAMLFTLISAMIPACTTTPTSTQQAEVTMLVDIAVALSIQNGTTDSAVWAERAQKIISISTQLLALADDTLASPAATAAALDPLLNKIGLTPAEILLANALRTTLAQLIAQNVPANSPIVTTVRVVLADTLNAAAVFLPRTPPAL